MSAEKRQHKRFSATAFLNKPVYLSPLPPYFGRPVKGKLIDLSAGGIALMINEIIPMDTFLNLKITFPDNSIMETAVQVKHVSSRGKSFVHGFQFLTLAQNMVERIDKMSTDYMDCESRINSGVPEICKGTECAFFNMCEKAEKENYVTGLESKLSLEFKTVPTR